MNGFNPYCDWLKVFVDSDHPNYYQLLELSPRDCSQRELVVAAAKRQLEKLKLLDAGQNRAALKSLVVEIKAALKCLSSVDARREYDNSLCQTTVAIPVAIPFAIPISDSNAGNLASEQSTEFIPIESIPVQDSPENLRLVVARKSKKRNSRLVFWSGHAVVLAAALATLVLLRPDLRERIFDGPLSSFHSRKEDRSVTGNTNPVLAPRTADQNTALAEKDPSAHVSISQPDLNKPSDNNKPVEKLRIGDANPQLSSVPAVNGNPAKPEAPTSPQPDKPNARLATVDAAKSPQLPDAAVDFYSRSIIALLSMNDIDAAVDFYSRMDSDSISEQRLEQFLRLAVVANSYSLYRDWLRECAEKIPGGTSLKVGSENLPIAIVKASPALIIFRDRGVNLRYPTELVPNAVAWGVIDQMRPGDPLAPILKLLAQYVKNWGQPEITQQTIGQLGAFEPRDSVGQKAKDAVLGWLQTDHPLLLAPPQTLIDLQDSRFTEAFGQVTAKYSESEQSEESIHEWIHAAFLETEPLQRIAQLEYAKRAAVDMVQVPLAVCIQLELARSIDPAAAVDENVKLIQGLGTKDPLPGEGRRLLVHIVRFINESGESIDAAQLQSVLRIATKTADNLKLDQFSDALQKAATRK